MLLPLPKTVFSDEIKAGTHILNMRGSNERAESIQMLYKDVNTFSPEHNILFFQRDIARSLREVSQGSLDFHYPMLCELPESSFSQYLRKGGKPLGKIIFLLVSRADNPVFLKGLENPRYTLDKGSVEKLDALFSEEDKALLLDNLVVDVSNGNLKAHVEEVLKRKMTDKERDILFTSTYPKRVIVDRAHRSFIELPSIPGNNLETSFRRLAAGRVDAMIGNAPTLMSLVSQYEAESDIEFYVEVFNYYDMCFLVAKNEHGRRIDELMSKVFEELKETEIEQKYFQPVHLMVERFIRDRATTAAPK